jgi:hypothetical protein
MEAFLELLGSCSEHTCYAPALVASLDWAVAHGNPRDLLLHCLAAVDMLTLDGCVSGSRVCSPHLPAGTCSSSCRDT